MADSRRISAHTLLLAFLELRRLSPDYAGWTEERLAGNPPRLFRLRQLVSMFRAFGLPWDPQSFTEGKFINPEHRVYAAPLKKLVERLPKAEREYFGEASPESEREEYPTDHQLPDYFKIMFDYRVRVDNVLSFSDGVGVSSGLYSLAHNTARELNRIVRDNLVSIDNAITELISPEGASFSVGQLAQDHDYPDVDLFAIDLDWW